MEDYQNLEGKSIKASINYYSFGTHALLMLSMS